MDCSYLMHFPMFGDFSVVLLISTLIPLWSESLFYHFNSFKCVNIVCLGEYSTGIWKECLLCCCLWGGGLLDKRQLGPGR